MGQHHDQICEAALGLGLSVEHFPNFAIVQSWIRTDAGKNLALGETQSTKEFPASSTVQVWKLQLVSIGDRNKDFFFVAVQLAIPCDQQSDGKGGMCSALPSVSERRRAKLSCSF